jgi:hypothetical protein
LRIDYDLDSNDYKQLLLYNINTSDKVQSAFRKRKYIGIAVILTLYLCIYLNDPSWLVILIGGIILIIHLIFSRRILEYTFISRDMKDSNLARFTGHYTAVISNEELVIIKRDNNEKIEFKWSKITSRGEDDWYFYLEQGPLITLLPKYHMSNEAIDLILNKTNLNQ